MLEGLLSFPNVSNHLILIGIYCILALSLNLINGSLGAFSLGHNGFWGMGAYAAGALIWLNGSEAGSLFVFACALLAGILAAAAFGLLVGVPCLRLRGDYLAIATLGFSEIFVICARNSESWTFFDEKRGLGGAAGFSVGDGHKGGNDVVMTLALRAARWWSADGPNAESLANSLRYVLYLSLTWACVALAFVTIRNLLRSAHGRAILAIREDETAAELLGVNLTRYKVLAFTVGAGFAGLAGALSATYRGTIAPNQFPMMEGIKVLLMVVLGGLGSLSGTLLAVPLLYVAEQALGTLRMQVPFPAYENGSFGVAARSLKDLWQVVFPFLLVLLILLKPDGLMGRREFSRAFFRETWARWRADPWPVAVTAVQWGQLALVLALCESPWLLALALLAAVGCQAFKRRRVVQRAAAAAARGGPA